MCGTMGAYTDVVVLPLGGRCRTIHAYPVLSHNYRFLQHLRTIDRKVSLSG